MPVRSAMPWQTPPMTPASGSRTMSEPGPRRLVTGRADRPGTSSTAGPVPCSSPFAMGPVSSTSPLLPTRDTPEMPLVPGSSPSHRRPRRSPGSGDAQRLRGEVPGRALRGAAGDGGRRARAGRRFRSSSRPRPGARRRRPVPRARRAPRPGAPRTPPQAAPAPGPTLARRGVHRCGRPPRLAGVGRARVLHRARGRRLHRHHLLRPGLAAHPRQGARPRGAGPGDGQPRRHAPHDQGHEPGRHRERAGGHRPVRRRAHARAASSSGRSSSPVWASPSSGGRPRPPRGTVRSTAPRAGWPPS